MSGLLIRTAAPSDLQSIVAITNEAITGGTALWTITPVTLEERAGWLARCDTAGLPVLVAEQDGAVAGFGSYGPFRPHEGYRLTVEHSLYVDPARRRTGTGRALLAALVGHAAEAGRHVMVGAIEAGNAASIALHEQAGFTRGPVLPEVGRKFDRWLDLLFMVRRL